MFFKTRDDLFLFLEHGKYEKYLSEFMEQQKQIKAPSFRSSFRKTGRQHDNAIITNIVI